MAKEEQKTANVSLRPLPVIVQMVEEIRAAKGYETASAVWYEAVRNMHSSIFPAYLAGKGRNTRTQEEDKLAPQRFILGKLGGEEVDRDGIIYAVWYNFHKTKAYRQEMPLDRLTDALIRNQYAPSKKKVEELRAAGKCDYDADQLTYE